MSAFSKQREGHSVASHHNHHCIGIRFTVYGLPTKNRWRLIEINALHKIFEKLRNPQADCTCHIQREVERLRVSSVLEVSAGCSGGGGGVGSGIQHARSKLRSKLSRSLLGRACGCITQRRSVGKSGEVWEHTPAVSLRTTELRAWLTHRWCSKHCRVMITLYIMRRQPTAGGLKHPVQKRRCHCRFY